MDVKNKVPRSAVRMAPTKNPTPHAPCGTATYGAYAQALSCEIQADGAEKQYRALHVQGKSQGERLTNESSLIAELFSEGCRNE
jgi:hypothetical protein